MHLGLRRQSSSSGSLDYLMRLLLWAWIGTIALVGASAEATEPSFSRGGRLPNAPKKVLFSGDSVISLELHSRKVHRSDDGGSSWREINLDFRLNHIRQHHRFSNYLYADSDTDIAVSDDFGETWHVQDSHRGHGQETHGARLIEVHNSGGAALFNGGKNPVLFETPTKIRELVDYDACVFALGNSTKYACIGGPRKTLTVFEMGTEDEGTPVEIDGLPIKHPYSISKRRSGIAVFTGHHNDWELLTSRDALNWQKPDLDNVKRGQVTLPGSHWHSLHLLVRDHKSDEVGTLYGATHDGNSFVKLIDNVYFRDNMPTVDRGVYTPGIILVNVMEEDGSITTRKSSDGGRTWISTDIPIRVGRLRAGRTLSPGPGIFMALGPADGKHLGGISDSLLYISKDGGEWTRHGDVPLLYGSADSGSVLVATAHGKTNTLTYSFDRGTTWQSYNFGKPVRAHTMFCYNDRPTCMLFGDNHRSFFIDFTPMRPTKCQANEVEKVYGPCIMGRRDYYYSPLPEANCYIGSGEFVDKSEVETTYEGGGIVERTPAGPYFGETCACVRADFECDADFVLEEDSKCVPSQELAMKLGACAAGKSMKISSGYRRIPGNTCKAGSTIMEGLVNYECDHGSSPSLLKPISQSKAAAAAAASSVVSNQVEFEGQLENYTYLKSDTEDLADETVLAWTTTGALWISHDQGTTWELSDIPEVVAVRSSKHFPNIVSVLTASSQLYLSKDRGKTFNRINVPQMPNPMGNLLEFHHSEPDWLLLHTAEDCSGPFESCPTWVYYSQNFGRSWKLLLPNVSRCMWIANLVEPTPKELVFCEHREDDHLSLLSSTDFFRSQRDVLLEKTYGIALDPPYVIAAGENGNDLVAEVSTDGKKFKQTRFPDDLASSKTNGFTVIDAHQQSVFLFASTSDRSHDFGAILKSNSDGMNYVVSINDVNRDARGYVDFEKAKSVEGVALANIVSNPSEARRGGRKALKTRITHSDGAFWDYLPAPPGACTGQDSNKCQLHLHGYTERIDVRNAPSSPSAPGVFVAQGNVGEFLTDVRQANTYITRDGGITWTEIADEPLIWEFGDSGSVIVTLPQDRPTNSLNYTLDEGLTWDEYVFSDELGHVYNIASIPSDTSRKFIVFMRPPASMGDVTKAIQIDFSGLTDRQCQFEGPNSDKDDFELWTPEHPQTGSKCLFGHETQYYRKIPGRECFVGKVGDKLGKPHKYLKNCVCTAHDFECDFNFYRADDGSCKLVDGAEFPSKDVQCANDSIAWRKINGYRKISIDTCEGGSNLADDSERLYACPGKEKEFSEQYGESGSEGGSGLLRFFGIVFFLVLVLGFAAVAVGFVLSKNQNGSGAIRLGEFEDDTGSSGFGRVATVVVGTAVQVGEQLAQLWDLALGKLDSRMRSGNVGLYSHIDDEERSRILDSDLEDDELDNPELGELLDEDERDDYI